MKNKLGISIYPEIVGYDTTMKYIDLAHKHGFKRIFANLLEIPNTEEGNEKLNKLLNVYKHAKDLGFEIILDVNPLFYKEFNLPKSEIDFFYKLNATGIRLDEDFGGSVESELTNNDIGFKIELNASSSTKTIDATLNLNGNPANLIACHNFYPMRFTGLANDRFIELSTHFRSKGVRVAAFITLPEKQNGIGPWNVNEGMPTLERHRDMSIDKQVLDMLSTNLVDDIIISQQGATEDQFIQINNILNKVKKIKSEEIIKIKIDWIAENRGVEEDIVFINKNKIHSCRPDYNENFIRSTIPRLDYKNDGISEYNSGQQLEIGDVLIVNENLGRYKGELHIVTKAFKDYNNSRNLVGKVNIDEMWKLPFIKGGIKFKLLK